MLSEKPVTRAGRVNSGFRARVRTGTGFPGAGETRNAETIQLVCKAQGIFLTLF